MVYIYVLKLKHEKYYIGKTNNPSFRLEDHFKNNGSAWTKKYNPIKLHELKPDCDNDDEDKITIQYMRKYGKDNVRGGSFCQIKLNKENETTLIRMINGSSDKCYNCGGDHFIKNCPNQPNKSNKSNKKRPSKCERCNRGGHTIDKCYAKTYSDGTYINESDDESDDEYDDEYDESWECQFCNRGFDTKKGCLFHENVHCTKRRGTKKNKFDPAKALWDDNDSDDCMFDSD